MQRNETAATTDKTAEAAEEPGAKVQRNLARMLVAMGAIGAPALTEENLKELAPGYRAAAIMRRGWKESVAAGTPYFAEKAAERAYAEAKELAEQRGRERELYMALTAVRDSCCQDEGAVRAFAGFCEELERDKPRLQPEERKDFECLGPKSACFGP